MTGCDRQVRACGPARSTACFESWSEPILVPHSCHSTLGVDVGSRRAGWWGIAFVVVLFVYGGMVSVPTSESSAQQIQAFYADHRSVIVIDQVLGILAIPLFVFFAVALARQLDTRGTGAGRWIIAAGILVVLANLGTVVPPLWLALVSHPSAGLARTLARAADLTDAALFAAIAVFAFVVFLAVQAPWLRGLCLIVAILALVRAVASPLGVATFDTVAPLAFLALVLLLGVLMLRGLASPGTHSAAST